MAEKKRPAAKSKKTVQKKSAKVGAIETSAPVAKNETPVVEPVKETAPVVMTNGNGHHDAETPVDADASENAMGAAEMAPVQQPKQFVQPLRMKIMDEYLIQCYFDKNQRLFIAFCAEFPELKITATSREEAVREMEYSIEDHIHELKARGVHVAEAFQNRSYPEKLEVPLSQALYRKLDILSRQEKLPLDRLVAEIIAGALERKQGGRGQGQPQQHSHASSHGHHNQRSRDNRGQGGGHRGGHRGGGNFGRDLDNRDNFLEYVRNLEKGGGSAGGGGGWKKR